MRAAASPRGTHRLSSLTTVKYAHSSRVAAWLLATLLALLVWLSPRSAAAYPWMIRHGYTGCAMCHADPSGGGLPTAYGRAQSELLMRTRYGFDKKADEEDADKLGRFLFGSVDLPESLLLGGDARVAGLSAAPSVGPSDSRFIHMQSDVQGQLSLGRVRFNGSIGYMHAGALPAALTRGQTDKLVSRSHWAGVALDEDETWLLRAGRMNLPFGLRTVMHTAWVRQTSRTDINTSQEHGASLAYSGDKVRGELMAFMGNLQVRPPNYWDHGFSAYVEYAAAERLAVGVSGLLSHSTRDLQLRVPAFRHAYGPFARYAPTDWLSFMGEVDMLVVSNRPNVVLAGRTRAGLATLVQGDAEVTRGVHVMLTGETKQQSFADDGASLGGWLSAVWFALPHTDLRIDLLRQSIAQGQNRYLVTTALGQLHFWL